MLGFDVGNDLEIFVDGIEDGYALIEKMSSLNCLRVSLSACVLKRLFSCSMMLYGKIVSTMRLM